MWPSLRLIFAAAVIGVVSFVVLALASTLALVRAQVERGDVDLASAIEADYSADPLGATLAPIDEEIVSVARQDVNRLQETHSGVQIVPVYHQPAPSATEPEVFATPSARPGQASPTPQSTAAAPTPVPPSGILPGWTPSGLPRGTPPPESPIATPLPTAAPTLQPTPGPSPIATLTASPTQTRTPTPGPSPSPTGSPTRTPTPTSTPAPTASPTRSPTPTPAPTESPTATPLPVNETLYLHNNPTPPLGDTAHQHELPMDSVLPGEPVLYNYDADRDNAEGLLIVKGGSGPDEGDDAKHQHWFTSEFATAVTIQGDASVKLWSAVKDFNAGLGGVVTVYLRDCEGWDCVELGSDTATKGGSSWMLLSFSVPIGTYTLAPGHSLELVVVVDASSDDDMWFAYDTGPYRSRVSMSVSADASAGETTAPHPLAYRPANARARLLFA